MNHLEVLIYVCYVEENYRKTGEKESEDPF